VLEAIRRERAAREPPATEPMAHPQASTTVTQP
jgi:hypothetical protein